MFQENVNLLIKPRRLSRDNQTLAMKNHSSAFSDYAVSSLLLHHCSKSFKTTSAFLSQTLHFRDL